MQKIFADRESIDWCLVSDWAAIPLHIKKLAVMVNGTTYAKKLRLNTRNGNRNIDIEKYI